MRVSGAWALGALILAACGGGTSEYSLLVDVVTDRPVGTDFDELELVVEDRLSGAERHRETVRADTSLDYALGARVARVEGLSAGQLLVTLRLRLAGALVAERTIALDLRSDFAVTLSFAAPPCAPETCNAIDDDCDGAVDENGALALCALTGAAESECVAGSCEILLCEAGRESCDGDAASGCEADLTLDTSCGACGVGCDEGTACDLGACRHGGRVEATRTLGISPAGEGRGFRLDRLDDGFLLSYAEDFRSEWYENEQMRALGTSLDDRWTATVERPTAPETAPVVTVGPVVGWDGEVHLLHVVTNFAAAPAEVVFASGERFTTAADTRGFVHERRDSESGLVVSRRLLDASWAFSISGTRPAGGRRLREGGVPLLIGVGPQGPVVVGGRPEHVDWDDPSNDRSEIVVAALGSETAEPRTRIVAMDGVSWFSPSIGGRVLRDGRTVFWLSEALRGEADFGDGPRVYTNQVSVAVSYDAAGELQWLERFRGAVYGGDVGDEGRLALFFADRVRVLDAAGAVVANIEHGASYIFESGVSLGPTDLYLTTVLGSETDFGGGPRSAVLDAMALAAYGADGTYRYDRAWSEPGTSRSDAVCANGDRVLLAGSYEGALDFGVGSPTSGAGTLLVLLRD